MGEILRRRFSITLGAHADRATFCLDRAMTISCGCSPCQTSVSTASVCGVIPHINRLPWARRWSHCRGSAEAGSALDHRHMEFNDLLPGSSALRRNRAITGLDLIVDVRSKHVSKRVFCQHFDDPTFLDALKLRERNALFKSARYTRSSGICSSGHDTPEFHDLCHFCGRNPHSISI